jgi:hypothetical protein
VTIASPSPARRSIENESAVWLIVSGTLVMPTVRPPLVTGGLAASVAFWSISHLPEKILLRRAEDGERDGESCQQLHASSLKSPRARQ